MLWLIYADAVLPCPYFDVSGTGFPETRDPNQEESLVPKYEDKTDRAGNPCSFDSYHCLVYLPWLQMLNCPGKYTSSLLDSLYHDTYTTIQTFNVPICHFRAELS